MQYYNHAVLALICLLTTVNAEAQKQCNTCPKLNNLVCNGPRCGTIDQGCSWVGDKPATTDKPTLKIGSKPLLNEGTGECSYKINEDTNPMILKLSK